MKVLSDLKRVFILTICVFGATIIFAQLNTEVNPGENFDLDQYKLNYPTYNTEEDDLSSFSNSYFFTDATTGGMVFKCPNIVDETGGSSYPRCELRELLNKGASASDKSNNWTLSTSASRDAFGGYNGILTATLSVDYVSTTGEEAQIGRVIVGQIHGKDNEPCRLYYRLLNGHSKGSVYFAHEQSNFYGDNKEEYWHVLLGSKSSSASEPEDGIELGQIWSYKIDVQGEAMTVSIYDEAGVILASKTISSDEEEEENQFDSHYGDSDNYLYFKAGVYNQNAGGEANDYAQATFYALSNNHDPGMTTLSVSPYSLNYTSNGEVRELSITTEDSWTATTEESWISLSQDSGNGNAIIDVTVGENTQTSMLQGSISIISADGSASIISVSQDRYIEEGEFDELMILSAVASIENTSKSEVASNVLDDDISTIWAGDGTDSDPTLDLSLAKEYMVSSIGICFSKQTERETYFSVQYWDGTDYIDLLMDQTQEVVDESQMNDLFLFNFTTVVQSDKIRVIGHGNSSSEWNSYAEVKLYGWDVPIVSQHSMYDTNKISFFPNPSTGQIIIENAMGGHLNIINLSGVVMHTEQISTNYHFSTSDLTPGVYFTNIIDKNNISHKSRLIIN